MEQWQSELTVITKTKDLSSYVITITQKSPKQFRFTFVSRMQNLCLDVIECLYRANDTFVKPGDQTAWNTRQKWAVFCSFMLIVVAVVFAVVVINL